VRQYALDTVGEVVVVGPAGVAGNQAFLILASYILGKNKGGRKFAMTAPVTQTASPLKREVTAPATQSAAPGGFLVQFFLPKGPTVATASEPLDPRVQLREVLPSQVAVIRDSGSGRSQTTTGIWRSCRRSHPLPNWLGKGGGLLALQRAVHTPVHAAQRDPVAPGTRTRGRRRSGRLADGAIGGQRFPSTRPRGEASLAEQQAVAGGTGL